MNKNGSGLEAVRDKSEAFKFEFDERDSNIQIPSQGHSESDDVQGIDTEKSPVTGCRQFLIAVTSFHSE